MAHITQSGREKRREYYRQWRRTHKEQVNAAMARYWNKRAEEDQAAAAAASEAMQAAAPAEPAQGVRG